MMKTCFNEKFHQFGYCTTPAAAYTSMPENVKMDTAILAVSIIILLRLALGIVIGT